MDISVSTLLRSSCMKHTHDHRYNAHGSLGSLHSSPNHSFLVASLLLVVRPGAPSSDALCSVRSFLFLVFCVFCVHISNYSLPLSSSGMPGRVLCEGELDFFRFLSRFLLSVLFHRIDHDLCVSHFFPFFLEFGLDLCSPCVISGASSCRRVRFDHCR